MQLTRWTALYPSTVNSIQVLDTHIRKFFSCKVNKEVEVSTKSGRNIEVKSSLVLLLLFLEILLFGDLTWEDSKGGV